MVIRTIAERVVYENDYITVYDDDVGFPDGSQGRYFRTRWKAPFGVAIAAVCDDRVLLIRNYRYAERAWSLEVPMGFGNADASPAENAARELSEETGLIATTLQPLLEFGSDYVTYAFRADLPSGSVPNAGHAERTEVVASFEWLPLDGLTADTIARVGVRDPMSVALLLTVAAGPTS